MVRLGSITFGKKSQPKKETKRVFKGPVPESASESIFRETGETVNVRTPISGRISRSFGGGSSSSSPVASGGPSTEQEKEILSKPPAKLSNAEKSRQVLARAIALREKTSTSNTIKNVGELRRIKGAGKRLVKGQKVLLSKEEVIKPKSQPIPLREDVVSLSQVIKTDGFFSPEAVRGVFKAGGRELVKFSSKISGQKLSQQQIKTGGKFVGETALFTGLLAPFPTSTQIAKQVSQPAKVTFVGVTQKAGASKNRVITDVKFRVDKGSTSLVGKSTGISQVKKLPKSNIFLTKSVVKGVTGKRSLTIRGTRLTDPQAFTSLSRGFGVKQGKVFTSISETATATASRTTATFGRGLTASKQVVGLKGLTAVKSRTISEFGIAESKGLLFPLKKQSRTFIDIASKKAQVILQLPKSSPARIGAIKQSALISTKSSIESFATTVPSTAVVSKIPSTLSLFSVFPRQKQRVSNLSSNIVPKPTPRYIDTSTPKISPTILSTQSQSGGLITRQRTISRSVPRDKPIQDQPIISREISKPRTGLRSKQISYQITKQRNKSFFSSPSFSSSNISTRTRFPFGLRKRPKEEKSQIGSSVFVKKKKKFIPVATGISTLQAINIGKNITSRTLSATFKITGAKGKLRTPTGFKKKPTKSGILFIEQPKLRLSKLTEVSAIQSAKRRKRR